MNDRQAIQSASIEIATAGRSMLQAATEIRTALAEHRAFLMDWLNKFHEVLGKHTVAVVRDDRPEGERFRRDTIERGFAGGNWSEPYAKDGKTYIDLIVDGVVKDTVLLDDGTGRTREEIRRSKFSPDPDHFPAVPIIRAHDLGTEQC